MTCPPESEARPRCSHLGCTAVADSVCHKEWMKACLRRCIPAPSPQRPAEPDRGTQSPHVFNGAPLRTGQAARLWNVRVDAMPNRAGAKHKFLSFLIRWCQAPNASNTKRSLEKPHTTRGEPLELNHSMMEEGTHMLAKKLPVISTHQLLRNIEFAAACVRENALTS